MFVGKVLGKLGKLRDLEALHDSVDSVRLLCTASSRIDKEKCAFLRDVDPINVRLLNISWTTHNTRQPVRLGRNIKWNFAKFLVVHVSSGTWWSQYSKFDAVNTVKAAYVAVCFFQCLRIDKGNPWLVLGLKVLLCPLRRRLWSCFKIFTDQRFKT